MAKHVEAESLAERRWWPAVMRRALAAEYTGVDESTIDRHRRAGRLRAAGRLGGNGPWTYSRVELDRWLTGGGPIDTMPVQQPGPRSSTSGSSAAALCRLQQLKAATR